jgi:hypothetical protein
MGWVLWEIVGCRPVEGVPYSIWCYFQNAVPYYKPVCGTMTGTAAYLDGVSAIVDIGERDDANHRVSIYAEHITLKGERFDGISLQWASVIEGLEDISWSHRSTRTVAKQGCP